MNQQNNNKPIIIIVTIIITLCILMCCSSSLLGLVKIYYMMKVKAIIIPTIVEEVKPTLIDINKNPYTENTYQV